jgi:hypothetical protein
VILIKYVHQCLLLCFEIWEARLLGGTSVSKLINRTQKRKVLGGFN